MENLDFIYKLRLRQLASTEIAIPMVCFCDIPLSQVQNHINRYGGYAIGLTKDWGEVNGINPVMYELPESLAVKSIKECLDITLPYLLGQTFDDHEYREKMIGIGKSLMQFVSFLKPYKGHKWTNNGFNGEEQLFYNEREWRYIPDFKALEERGIKPYFYKYDYLNSDKKNKYEREIENNFKLRFEPKDIKYIIVAKDEEVLDMTYRVREIKERYRSEEVELLITKIISSERIKDDF